MEFGVLGPLRVVAAGREVLVASSRQRALLTVLLLSANQGVSTARLVDELWGTRPADSAQNLVRTYVWRLRALLADEDDGERLFTEPSGYRLRVEPGELDLAEFERLARLGRAALQEDRPAAAAEQLRRALALWRGPVFEDVTLCSGAQPGEIARLDEARTAALEDRVDADLALGRHGELLGELTLLTAREPLRERPAAQLMLACYRSGRQAEALAAYRRLRAALADELGLDPGREVQDLHRRILRADADLAVGRAARRVTERIVPRQLPAAPGQFVGRAGELKALTGLLDRMAAPGGTAVISAVKGGGGIGKTALALHWARLHLARFPDGQLYVDLRGFAPGARPAAPGDALRGFLDALSVPAERVPRDLDARSALYRSLLEDKRMLVVLDNARDSEQVRPLLPGGPACLTLVTSRNPLAGLVAAEAARSVALDVLTPDEAEELLAARLGPERAAAEPRAVAALAELCARLPLALNIAAARADANPALPLSGLVAQLRDARSRLDALDIGEATTDLRAVFSWSYEHLAPPAARMFRLLGLHAGPDITAPAAASLAAVRPADAERLLAGLTRAHLLTEHGPGRYGFHDLLRAYAAELAAARDGPDERRAALHRVLDHYLHTAHRAALLVYPTRDPITLDPPRPGTAPESPGDDRHALAWFEAERPVLLAAVAQAASEGFDVHACKIPWALASFLDRRGHWADYVAVNSAALAVARRSGDLVEQARAHRGLGIAHIRLGDLAEARTHLGEALELGRELGDRVTEAHAHHLLGSVLDRQGLSRQALGHAQCALELYREAGHRGREALALSAVGWLHARLGDYERSLSCCQQALDLHLELGDDYGAAAAWDSLGYAQSSLGRHDRAVAAYQRALDLRLVLGDRYKAANTLVRLGEVHEAAGQLQAARDARQRALGILDELGHPDADRVRAVLGAGEGEDEGDPCAEPELEPGPGTVPETAPGPAPDLTGPAAPVRGRSGGLDPSAAPTRPGAAGAPGVPDGG